MITASCAKMTIMNSVMVKTALLCESEYVECAPRVTTNALLACWWTLLSALLREFSSSFQRLTKYSNLPQNRRNYIEETKQVLFCEHLDLQNILRNS